MFLGAFFLSSVQQSAEAFWGGGGEGRGENSALRILGFYGLGLWLQDLGVLVAVFACFFHVFWLGGGGGVGVGGRVGFS